MKAIKSILLGGLAAGALDILYAFIVYGPVTYGLSPMRVLQSVAAGWIGRDAAVAGGMQTAVLGLASHFAIATIMAAVFVVAASIVGDLRKRAIFWGFVYGLILYVAMNYVVTPLSAAHSAQHFAADAADALARLQVAFSAVRPAGGWMLAGTILTHTVLVGVPIAVINRAVMRAR